MTRAQIFGLEVGSLATANLGVGFAYGLQNDTRTMQGSAELAQVVDPPYGQGCGNLEEYGTPL